jgi:hypothetical protein
MKTVKYDSLMNFSRCFALVLMCVLASHFQGQQIHKQFLKQIQY